MILLETFRAKEQQVSSYLRSYHLAVFLALRLWHRSKGSKESRSVRSTSPVKPNDKTYRIQIIILFDSSQDPDDATYDKDILHSTLDTRLSLTSQVP